MCWFCVACKTAGHPPAPGVPILNLPCPRGLTAPTASAPPCCPRRRAGPVAADGWLRIRHPRRPGPPALAGRPLPPALLQPSPQLQGPAPAASGNADPPSPSCHGPDTPRRRHGRRALAKARGQDMNRGSRTTGSWHGRLARHRGLPGQAGTRQPPDLPRPRAHFQHDTPRSPDRDHLCRFSSGLASDTSPDQDTGQFS